MKTTIYANYSSPEKEIVYSTDPADNNVEILIDIPDAYETYFGDIALKLGEQTFLLNQVLANANSLGQAQDRPVLRWHDGQQYHTRELTVIG